MAPDFWVPPCIVTARYHAASVHHVQRRCAWHHLGLSESRVSMSRTNDSSGLRGSTTYIQRAVELHRLTRVIVVILGAIGRTGRKIKAKVRGLLARFLNIAPTYFAYYYTAPCTVEEKVWRDWMQPKNNSRFSTVVCNFTLTNRRQFLFKPTILLGCFDIAWRSNLKRHTDMSYTVHWKFQTVQFTEHL